jgi:hypothetical protein
MSISKYIFFLFLLLFVTRIEAQQKRSGIRVKITEQHSEKPIPVRIKIIDSNDNVTALPDEAISIMYGRDDKAQGYGYQPDESFYVDGLFKLDLDAGKYRIHLSKGVEYLDQTFEIELKEGEQKELNFDMKRWVNMPDLSWYSADDHIHIRRSPRENPLILKWIEAEGLNVGVMLQMGDILTTYFSQYSFGDEGVYNENGNFLTSGQEEPRTHEIGHTIAMVADDFHRENEEEYYYYDNYFDKIHELDGIMGYAHQGISFNGYIGMTLDVLDDKVDFLELIQFCVEGGPLLTQNYYHFLDLGFKMTATAGSDFPWCGNDKNFGTVAPSWNSRIGNVRFYTYIEGEFNYKSWKENLKAGHTFATSGPMIVFNVNDKFPGDEINLNKKGKVTISAKAFGNHEQVPLTKLEIIAHGKVIQEIIPNNSDQSTEQLTLNFELEIENGIWIAARCYAGPNQVAHTTPIYITIDGNGFYNKETLQDYLALNEKYLEELEKKLIQPAEKITRRVWWYKKGLKERIERTRKKINILKEMR